MKKEIIKFVGRKIGSTSVIIVGNHGNERCGILALEKLVSTLKIDFGTVIFIIGNINACVENVRFTEFNLNRMFKSENLLSKKEKGSYEYFRAQYIKMYLDKADAVLDIHSSSTPESISFAICEKNAFKIARNLPIKAIVSGFATANPGGIYSYVNSVGKIGLAIECGEHNDPHAQIIAYEAILKFLYSQGHIQKHMNLSECVTTKVFFEAYLIYKSKTNCFKRNLEFKDFQIIDPRQVIGKDGKMVIRAEENSVILFAHDSNKIGDEVFVLCRQTF